MPGPRCSATPLTLATKGPATFDGYGAFSAADGLLAAFAGRDPEPPLRYRPATREDSELLLAWRNDPEVRAASRSTSGDIRGRARSVAVENSGRRCPNAARGRGTRNGPWARVRFDERPRGAEISVVVAPNRRGGGPRIAR